MSGHAYYNEIDPAAAQWLRRLIKKGEIAKGDVDERSIANVSADDLRGYKQAHFFAGIAGWSRALRLAGWPDDAPVWTGSCPCQPFSEAGHGEGFDDPRHLWPEFYRLISKCRPPIVFGEQVRNAKVWLDAVLDDLEGEGYACGAALLPACSVGARHRRDRFWFVADATSARLHAGAQRGVREGKALARPRNGEPQRLRGARASRAVANTDGFASVGPAVARQKRDPWRAEPCVGRVVDGVSHKLVEPALRAFGNAIVPQVAAEFIKASAEAIELIDVQRGEAKR